MLQAWKFDMIQRIRSPSSPLTTGTRRRCCCVFFLFRGRGFFWGHPPPPPKKTQFGQFFFGPRQEQECRANISERSLGNFPTSRFLLGPNFLKEGYSAGLHVVFSSLNVGVARWTSLTFPQPKGLAMWRTFELLGIADFMRKHKV